MFFVQSQSCSISQRTNIFEIVRNIPLEDVLSRYSPTEGRHKTGHIWFNCPFHQDEHPSLKAKGQRWRCFGCGAWGDGVDYVSKLYGLTLLAAANQIASDFGIMVNSVLTEQQRKAIATTKKARHEKKVFYEAVDRAYQKLCDVRIECCQIIDAAGDFGFRFSHVSDVIDAYLNVLLFGTDTEKEEFLTKGIIEHWLSSLIIAESHG